MSRKSSSTSICDFDESPITTSLGVDLEATHVFPTFFFIEQWKAAHLNKAFLVAGLFFSIETTNMGLAALNDAGRLSLLTA